MCGIHAVISRAPIDGEIISPSLKHCLCNRGPDHLGTANAEIQPSTEDGFGFLRFTSTVLSLRGDHVTKQPLIDPDSGSVLCWNGEAWKFRGQNVQGNDGQAVFNLLTSSSGARKSRRRDEESTLDVLRSIEGPFAFVYFERPTGLLYFGRDRLGRRSLLVSWSEAAGRLTLSSIAGSTDALWQEVESDGIYVINLPECEADWSDSLSSIATGHDWLACTSDNMVSYIGIFNTSLPSKSDPLVTGSLSIARLRGQLTESLSLRVLNVPRPTEEPGRDTRIAVLFSGGLDCTVLARMTHDLVPRDQGIDLINVAFENPRIALQLAQSKEGIADIYEACPDRITGRKSFDELQNICPGRAWRFIAVNVPYTETTNHRSQVISLMYPHNTEMDLSIAYALYFAARGQGLCFEGSDTTPQASVTPARVLLSGLGADELFGGYVRHGTAFSRRGYPGLIDELKLDVSRLGKRNLGRDDRVMAHWGREVRFPYLDEELVKWAIECPVWEKCDFENKTSGGVEAGKRILRLLAMGLGMVGVASERKRAIQFGSRTAKMENGKVKGTTLIS